MKNVLSIVLILIVLCTSFTINAEPVIINYNDTTLLVENNSSHAMDELFTVIPSNVVFPATLEENREMSLDYIHKYSDKKRNYLLNTYKQGKKIFPKVSAILKRYGLPEELKVLIALESGFNANAISTAGAVGYWQIMDDVAMEYGLKISSPNANEKENNKPQKKDERKNFLKSTITAARYLRDRCKNLNNDLLLIVAAYNWGVGNIWSVMKKCGKSNPTFWDVKKYLPTETRNYVMNFITFNVIFTNYENFSKKSLVFTPKTIKVTTTPAIISNPELSESAVLLQ